MHQDHHSTEEHPPTGVLDRAQGCLLGQLAGDALGSMVEFQRPEDIQRQYPHGLRELVDGGFGDTIAGQPTDDSEMALTLTRLLVARGPYDATEANKADRVWPLDALELAEQLVATPHIYPKEDHYAS